MESSKARLKQDGALLCIWFVICFSQTNQNLNFFALPDLPLSSQVVVLLAGACCLPFIDSIFFRSESEQPIRVNNQFGYGMNNPKLV